MPRNWLNIFTAVRNANEFEADQAQRQIENKRQDELLGFRRSAEQREATDWNSERQRQVSMAALTAYGDAAAQIQDPEQRAAAFDRIIPALSASGFDTQRIGEMRTQVVERPEFAGEIVRAIRAGTGSPATYAPRAVIDPATGRARYVRPGDEIGQEPADDYLAMGRLLQGDRRLDLGEDRLEHDVYTDSPEYVEERNLAEAGGTARGEVAAILPRLDEITDTAISRVDELIAMPGFDAIFGLPNLSRLDTGGFGAAGVIPGTPAADALARLNETIGDVQTAAYESLRGGGQITEAEREAVAQGITNLQRAQSPQSAVAALQRLVGVLDRRRLAQHRIAQTPVTGGRPQQPSRTYGAPRGRRAAGRRENGEGEFNGSAPLRNQGENADQLLDRLGL